MYEIDHKLTDDEAICENCEIVIDENSIIETCEGNKGCTECISRCAWCGNYYFDDEMESSPYFGKTCKICVNSEESQKATDQEIEKESLRCYFDSTTNKQIEELIIIVAWNKGFRDLAREMKNDIK